MKKLSYLAILLLGVSLTFSACGDECTTCYYDNALGDRISEEICGGSDEELAAAIISFSFEHAFDNPDCDE